MNNDFVSLFKLGRSVGYAIKERHRAMKVLNALLKASIVRGQSDKVVWGENGLKLQISRSSEFGGGEGSSDRFHPFKVYNCPGGAANLWRTFRVRAGAYGTTAVAGTDEADQCPDDATVQVYPSYDADVDFVVSSGTAAYYVWIDISTPASPVIDHGTTAPDPLFGGDAILLAVIDTDTDSGLSKAWVRQYVRDDVPICS